MSIDIGSYGAKRQSTRRASPRDILLTLLKQHPAGSERVLLGLFTEKVIERRDYLDVIIEYWFTNNYRSLFKKTMSPDEQAKRAEEFRIKREEVKAEIKRRATRMVLLDLAMPNGKALRDCTGRDCKKAGGWFTKLAKMIKPDDVVGKVLSETQVRKVWQKV
jgi:hypothetical protein